MITVDETFEMIAQACRPLGSETVPIEQAEGRVLSAPARANHAQPPFDASAMDGYAIRRADAQIGQRLTVIGESAAGHGFAKPLGVGDAVRIFTGGVVPQGADMILIQENVTRNGDHISITDINSDKFIRPKGSDFPHDFELRQGHKLTPADIMLLAAMNVPYVQVPRRPVVAILSTGDELVPVGSKPSPDQIISSNQYGIAALTRSHGGIPRIFPLIPDDHAMLRTALEMANSADIVVFSGGASVGDHDLVAPALQEYGAQMQFHKIAMRPGKPLMLGTKGHQLIFGLPGNPVSAFVCARLFLCAALKHVQSLPDPRPKLSYAPLRTTLSKGGAREHYMRGILHDDGTLSVRERQDSSLISVLASSNVLIPHPINAEPQAEGALQGYLTIFPNQA